MSIASIVAGIIKPVSDLISEFIPDADKANEMRTQLAMAQGSLQGKLIEQQSALDTARSAIIIAEAKSGSWLTANWRPLTMVVFVGILVAKWFGFTADDIDPALELELMSLIKIGLGGYVGGRTVEKVLPSVASIFAKK